MADVRGRRRRGRRALQTFRSFPRRGESHVRVATNLLPRLAFSRMWLPDRSTEQRSDARESTALSSGLRCFCWDVGLLIEGHGHEPSSPDEVPCALDTLSLRRARRRGGPCRAFSTSTVLAPGTSVKRQRVGPCCLADRAVPAPLLKNGSLLVLVKQWAHGTVVPVGLVAFVTRPATGVQAPPARAW